MTKEEAINIIDCYDIGFYDLSGEKIRADKLVEAFDMAIKALQARPQEEWIDCKEPPSTDRNVFIAYGTDNMNSVCIGHYRHDMKLWYEDRNFFTKPIYDAMYWCEIPQFHTQIKGADDETEPHRGEGE